MRTPDEAAAMVQLKELGWGVRRIAGEFGCSHETVRRYLKAGAGLRTGPCSAIQSSPLPSSTGSCTTARSSPFATTAIACAK